jgi:hypothetical protein
MKTSEKVKKMGERNNPKMRKIRTKNRDIEKLKHNSEEKYNKERNCVNKNNEIDE